MDYKTSWVIKGLSEKVFSAQKDIRRGNIPQKEEAYIVLLYLKASQDE
jgi:hypothetical protein